jgi:hypothetical protein
MKIGRIFNSGITVFILDAQTGEAEHSLFAYVEVFLELYQSFLPHLLRKVSLVAGGSEPISEHTHHFVCP